MRAKVFEELFHLVFPAVAVLAFNLGLGRALASSATFSPAASYCSRSRFSKEGISMSRIEEN